MVYVVTLFERRQRRTDCENYEVDAVRVLRTSSHWRLHQLLKLAEKYYCRYSVVEVAKNKIGSDTYITTEAKSYNPEIIYYYNSRLKRA